MADYIPANADTGNGDWLERHQQEVEDEKQRQAADPTRRQAYTNEELMAKYGDLINAAGGLSSYSQNGGYTQDPSAGGTPTTYNGQEGWYEYAGTPRTVQQGASGADEQFLSDGSYAIIQQLKQEYEAAKARGDTAAMEAAHAEAERIRARAGYSGGADGSHYLTFGELGIERSNPNAAQYRIKDTGESGGTDSQEGQLKSLLDQWREAALQQQNGKIDYAVAQAVAELERALEDAQPKFKEQAEAVARDEMQGLDNSALYAEARGDKGGIGQSQYNEIQAAAAQNRLAVQQAQTKLSTDTARQIADLRAQGEFEKADAALEIAQSYLSQLIGLEQWAAEFGLTQAQFQESIRQWEAEYNLAMQQFKVDTDLSYAQLTGKLSDGTLTLNGKSQLADMGEALLSAGIMPSADQLEAMGMTEAQAGQYLTMLQLEAEQKKAGGNDTGGDDPYKPKLTWAQVLKQIEAENLTPEVLEGYEYYMGQPFDTGETHAETPVETPVEKTMNFTDSDVTGITNRVQKRADGLELIYVDGFDPMTFDDLFGRVKAGLIIEEYNEKTGKLTYRRR